MVRRLSVVLLVALTAAVALAEPRGAWLTPAEAADFEATPSLAETMAFLERLAPLLPEMYLTSFGTSGEGRALPLVIVSKQKAFDPVSAAALGRPVILIQNGIHPGEIDGKDACLIVLRDLALGRHREILDAGTLLIVPVYNVDGHERMSPHNRPNQDGPHRGMGFRTNATGLDLNRDFVKAQAPETRAMLALFNRWRPDLHVDIHVTDGVDMDWVLTYARSEAPQLPVPVERWATAHLPKVIAATEAAGHRCGPYVDLVDRDDPAKGFSSWVGGPRFATGYFPLRNRLSVLLEMHSYKPYRERVEAVRDFLVALLDELRDSGGALDAAVAQAEAGTVVAGAPAAPPSPMVLGFKESVEADSILFPVYASSSEPSVVTGRSVLRYRRGEVAALTVPWHHRVEPAVSVTRPRGYLVLPGWPQISEALAAHGLRVTTSGEGLEADVEVLTVRSPRYAASTYQGLSRVEATVATSRERRTFPPGTLWIAADQPDFEVAAQLLEPEAPDSLLQWGLLSTVFERKEYIGAGVLEDFARQALRSPGVADEWAAALRDQAFADNPRARYQWWYERTPSWQVQHQGELPVFRAMSLPEVALAP